MDKFIVVISFILFLVGCQDNSSTISNNLYNDAEYIYKEIEKNNEEGQYLDEYTRQKIKEFNENYVKKYDELSLNDQTLVKEMDKLINSYTLYFVSLGRDDKTIDYKDNINESLDVLKKQFNN